MRRSGTPRAEGYPPARVRIVVVGAGQVGSTIVEALHGEHDLTVIDIVRERLEPLAYRYDVGTIEANGASRQALRGGRRRRRRPLHRLHLARRGQPRRLLVRAGRGAAGDDGIRTSNVEYIDLWREGRLDVDFAVSSELETAHAVSRSIGMPAARQTDVFADGQVQIVEFEVPRAPTRRSSTGRCARRSCRTTRACSGSSAATADAATRRRSDPRRRPHRRDRLADGGARVGQPARARRGGRRRTSSSSAAVMSARRSRALLAAQGIGVRLIEPDRDRAREVAEELPECRVYNATGIDPDFLERERIGRRRPRCSRCSEDAKNHYAATLARVHGVRFTIAIVHDRLDAGLRAVGDRRDGQPARGHRRGDRALRARPANAAGGDARGRSLRGARHDDASRRASTSASGSATCRSAAR